LQGATRSNKVGERLMSTKKVTEKTISTELVSKILRTVSMTEVFHFFTDIGQYARAMVDLSISTRYWIALQKEGIYHEES
jgi:hypothetical protein